MVGSGGAFISPPRILLFYEDSHIILPVESTTKFRGLSRKIVVKNPRVNGDFSFGEQ